MGGTRSGGRSARDTNLVRYGKDFYKRIGAIGGAKSTTGGFYGNSELASIAGAKGGAISRKPASLKTQCKWGHKLTEENTYRYTSGARSCKTCMKLHSKLQYQKDKLSNTTSKT